MSNDQLQRILGSTGPALVRAALTDGTTRDLMPPKGTRKRWSRILDTLGKLPWVSVELLDQRGATLGIFENPDMQAIEEIPPAGGDMAKVIISAQREALTWQDKSVRAALDACVAVMKQQADAVTQLSRTYQAQIDALAELANSQPSPQASDDDVRSNAMVQALLPMIVAKLGPALMAPSATKPPGSQPGGVNGKSGS